jgi:hypothetical protein
MVTSISMTSGSLRGWLVLTCISAGVISQTPDASVLAATPTPSSALELNLRLTVSEGLSPISRQALVSEAHSIWQEGRVRLKWLAGGAEPGPGPSLRVLVTPRAVSAVPDGGRWPVGELLRFEGTAAIAVASITGAQRIVDESRRYWLLDLPAVYDHRLGVVLGRAVAHEIGHYVLKTNTHASEGLMRASIDAREFADPRRATFRLDEEAEAYVATLARRDADAGAHLENGFSYSRR